MTKKFVWAICLIFFTIAFTAFSQNVEGGRESAVAKLEHRINKNLLNIKTQAKFPKEYEKIWAYNLEEADVKDLMQKNIKVYNQIVSVQQDYKRGLENIREMYPDEEMAAIEEKKKSALKKFYEKIETQISRNVGPKTRGRFQEEMKSENFMKTKFEEIDYFKKYTRQLEGAQKVQNQFRDEYEAINREYRSAKENLIAQRMEESRQRAAEYENQLQTARKEKAQEEEEGFLDNFWIGIKTGVNYSTGSSGDSAEAAPGVGFITEYTVFKIKPIAFEAAVELNVNYIQKPVTVEEGKINTDYVNIPVFAKGKWPAHIPLGFGDFTPFIGIGVDPYLRLSSSFYHNETKTEYAFDTRGFNIGFVWNLGGELNVLDIGTATLEFRMSLGASSGIPAYTVPTGNVTGGEDVSVPEQRQNGYMIFVGWKMALGTLGSIF
jgi:hypothetical protein